MWSQELFAEKTFTEQWLWTRDHADSWDSLKQKQAEPCSQLSSLGRKQSHRATPWQRGVWHTHSKVRRSGSGFPRRWHFLCSLSPQTQTRSLVSNAVNIN
jgi:hypothetical protein